MFAKKKTEIPSCENCVSRYKSIFCNLNLDELRKISECKSCAFYKRGQVIFRENAYPHGMFCINNGKVKISKTGTDGKEHIVRFAKDGDIIGYRSLLGGEAYTASAYAIVDTDICYIPRETFFQILENNMNFALQVMKRLSTDLKTAEEKIINIAQKPVRERIAEALLYLKEIYGVEEDQKTLNVILKREELANMVGTSLETTIRLLSEFNKEKLVLLNGKKITILNHKKLLRTANVFD